MHLGKSELMHSWQNDSHLSNLATEAEERRNKSFKMCHGNSITTSEFEKNIIGEKRRNIEAM